MAKLQKYSAYKDSGVEWLGEIPVHWEMKRLKFLCSIMTGSKNTEDKTENGAYPFYVRSQTPEKINSYSYNGEAILTAGDGAGVGKVFHYVNGKFDYHQRVYKFSDFYNIDGKYLFYFIQNNFYNVAILGTAKSTVDSLRLPLIQDFSICFPASVNNQTAIANFLDHKTGKIDKAISIKQKQIALLKEYKQIIIQNAVTKGITPNVKMKDSGVEWIGEIPEGWEVRKLKRITKFIYGDTLQSENRAEGDIPVYGSNGIVGYHNIAITQNPCIIVGRKGSHGKINYSKKSCFPIDTTFFIDKTVTENDLRWLFYMLQTLNLDETSQDTGVPGLNRKVAYAKLLQIPPLHEQTAIANFLDHKTEKINKAISLQEQQIEKLKEYKATLINSAVTGKIKIDGHGY